MDLKPAIQPTMYFIGVTTNASSIMKVFPDWAKTLNLKDTVIKGIDIEIHAKPEVYREVVEFIKNDPMSCGALVTTHKIDLYSAAWDCFAYLDPYASMFGEISSISKTEAGLCGHAKDPITCGMALEEFVPANYWATHPDAGVFVMGAGGSAISLCSYFTRKEFAGNYPSRIVVANRSKPRLDQLMRVNEQLDPGGITFEYHLTPRPEQNDEVLATMHDGSLIINATGLGKDRPGSPLTDAAVFPRDAMVWEINYRGELPFMRVQAEKHRKLRNLDIQDGWMYFIYGWTQVIAEVFHMSIQDELLRECARIAQEYRK